MANIECASSYLNVNCNGTALRTKLEYYNAWARIKFHGKFLLVGDGVSQMAILCSARLGQHIKIIHDFLDKWMKTISSNADDAMSESDANGILKTMGRLSKCLQRPLVDIFVDWTFRNKTMTSNSRGKFIYLFTI